VAAVLFAVHPVHVEVTGNIVGQSELIVAICLCVAVGVYLRARVRGGPSPREMGAIFSLYAVGLMSKEHAIVLPALLLAAEGTVLRDVPWRGGARRARILALAFVLISLLYLYVRGLVQKDLAGFIPYPAFRYLNVRAVDRLGTMMTEIPRVGRLLLFPSHLSADYSPAEVFVARGLGVEQLPGIFICLGVALLALALRKRSPVASFGLLWLIVAFLPVSNLIIPAGFITAERTLFLPSVGVVLVAGEIVAHLGRHDRRGPRLAGMAAVGILLVLGLARSIDRQRVWRNNDVFFEALIRDQPNGYRAHFLRGRHLASHSRLREAEQEYKRAMKLFPYDVGMMVVIASDYQRAGLCGPTVALLRWSYSVDPRISDGRLQYVQCLGKEGHWAESRTEALEALRVAQPAQVPALRAALARADSTLGRRAWQGKRS
jgi:hypothetical protein